MAQHAVHVEMGNTMLVEQQQVVHHVRLLVDGQHTLPAQQQVHIQHVIRHRHQATVQVEQLREQQAV